MAAAAKKRKPDWHAIKAEYLRGGLSLRKLAAKHGVSADTLMKRAAAEKWKQDRQQVESRLAAELPAKIAGSILDQVVQINEEQARDLRELWGLLIGEARNVGTQSTHWVNTADGAKEVDITAIDKLLGLRRAASGLKEVQDAMRKALGIDKKPTPADPTDPLDRLTQAIEVSRARIAAEQPTEAP